MKLKIDKHEIDVDLHGVANFLMVTGAAMHGDDMPDFVDTLKQVDALSLVCVAVMLSTDAAEMLMRAVVKSIDDFVGESGGISAAKIRIRNDLKRFES